MLAMKLTRLEDRSDDEEIARLIDWHTPEPEPAYRPRHCASLEADPEPRQARLVRAFTVDCQTCDSATGATPAS